MRQAPRLLILLAIIVLSLAIAARVYSYLRPVTPVSDAPVVATSKKENPVDIDTPWRGDLQKTVLARKSAEQNTALSKDERAMVMILTTGSEYLMTGDLESRIRDMDTLKAIFLDTEVTLEIRVAALNAIASTYADSGRDQKVFDALSVSKPGEPWGMYVVPKDPDQTSLNLYTWSYSLQPTTIAAIQIAHWYAARAFIDNTRVGTSTTENVAKAAQYLEDADRLSRQDQEQSPQYVRGNRNAVYRTWKAITILELAHQSGGEVYQQSYRKVADEFIEYAKDSKNFTALNNLFYVRFHYAVAMQSLNDDRGARVQLDALAQELNALQDPDAKVFVKFMRNSVTLSPAGHVATWFRALSGISVDFDAVTKKLLATSRPSSAPSSSAKLR